MCDHQWFWIGQDTARNNVWRCPCGVTKTDILCTLTAEEQPVMRELIANYDELERREPVCHHEWIRITASTRASPPTPHWMCSKCGRCTQEHVGDIGCDQEK